MNQMLTTTVIDALMSLLPAREPKVEPQAMTRREKLQRWAHVVRACPTDLCIFHALERQPPGDLAWIGDQCSAFHLAGTDQVLLDQGIKLDLPPTTSAAEVMRFFELSQQQLHEFSCDCGGDISASQMADRIEAIARRA